MNALNQNPGEHFTPREVIRLMVDLVLMFDTELASGEGVARTVNVDPANNARLFAGETDLALVA